MQNLSKQFAVKAFASFENRLTRSLALLTIFYSITIGIIILISAGVTYSYFSSRVDVRFKKYKSVDNTVIIEAQTVTHPTEDGVRDDLLDSLISVDGLLFVLSVLLSYLLARMSLRPLKQSYEEQKRFIADASHELRTPLAVMKLELENELVNNMTVTDKNKIENLRIKSQLEEVDRMSNIVSKLLVLSKLEDSNGIRKIINIDITKVVKDVISRYESLSKSHDVLVSLNSPVKSIFIKGNDQVEHVIGNIIENAIKYNKKNGDLPGKVEVLIEEKSKQVEIVIKDTGIGITENDLGRIYERFYRADKSRTRATGGTGLGLAIAKEGIESVGGTMRVESKISEGTEVHIIFMIGIA